MTASIQNGRLITRCEVCGQPASFGTGVNNRQAKAAKERGNMELAKRHLGKWLCGKHWKKNK